MMIPEKAQAFFEPIEVSRQTYRSGDPNVSVTQESISLMEYLASEAEGLQLGGEKLLIKRARCLRKMLRAIENACAGEEFELQDIVNGRLAITVGILEYDRLIKQNEDATKDPSGVEENKYLKEIVSAVQNSNREALCASLEKLDDLINAVKEEWKTHIPRGTLGFNKSARPLINDAARLAKTILQQNITLEEHDIDENQESIGLMNETVTMHEFLNNEVMRFKGAESKALERFGKLLKITRDALLHISKYGDSENRFELENCVEMLGQQIKGGQGLVQDFKQDLRDPAKLNDELKTMQIPESNRARRWLKRYIGRDVGVTQSYADAYIALQSGLISMLKILDQQRGEEQHAR